MNTYDIVILGGNVEGMSAAVYCCRKGLKTLLIESPEVIGGDLDHLKLIHRLKQQASDFGANFIQCQVHSLWCKNTPKIVYADHGPIGAKSLILAMGTSPKKLGVPMESYFHGCGLHYHDSCTSSYLKGRIVAVYGKDDKAVNHAITLSNLCKQVYLIHPEGSLACSPSKAEALKRIPNMIILPHTLIYGIDQKNKKIVGINIIDKTTGNLGVLDCEIVYVSKGCQPNSKLCFPYILTDRYGFVVTDRDHKTNIDGIFAAGSIRSSSTDENPGSCCSQDITMAATDGAIAAINAVKYVESLSS